MLRAIDISTSGLVAQRQRMNTISENLANINTTRDANGHRKAFQRRMITFQSANQSSANKARGVGVEYNVEIDPNDKPRLVHQPNHPDANDQGYVEFPGINMIKEMVNAMEASRAYEANLAALSTSKSMAQQSMRILE